MGSLQGTLLDTRHAVLSSKDPSVTLHVSWARFQDVNSETKFGSDFVTLAIDSTSGNTKSIDQIHAPGPRQITVSITEIGNAAEPVAEPPVIVDEPGKAVSFLWKTATGCPPPPTITFLLPAEDGFIVRSDFVSEMFRTSTLISQVEGFVAPGQRCTVPRATKGVARTLLALLDSSVAAIVPKTGTNNELLVQEMKDRLSWPWSVPVPLKTARLVLIGEKRHHARVASFYSAAAACGVSVIVMDKPGHWMEDPTGPGAHLREAFIPFRGYTFEGLPRKIVDTVQGLPFRIDGLMTCVDAFLPGVARAAEILGLPTVPAEAYRRAGDKFQTRQLCPTPTSIKVDSLAAFLADLGKRSEPLEYPLVVKPTRGHGSEGASRVENQQELVEAVTFAFGKLAMQQKGLDVAYDEAPVIVETYIEGPEVDVNFVFWEGELLFSEVTDNLPCTGDGPPGGRVEMEHFGLQGSVFPSGLPPDEVEMLKRDVLAIVRQLGVCSGVVQAEAKVHNSSVEWHTGDDGVQDLRPRVGAGAGGQEARTFLLEVNVRFPGTMDLTGSYLVNGVDFYSLSITHAVGDEARFRSLAVGYRNRPLYQFGYTLLRLSTPSGGRMPGHLGLDKVGLNDHYMLHWQYWSPGEAVPDPGERPWPGLGFIYWRSTKSRRDLMEKVAIARRDLDVQLIVE